MSSQRFDNGKTARRYPSVDRRQRESSVSKLGQPKPGVHNSVYRNVARSTRESVEAILKAQREAIDKLNATTARLQPQLMKQLSTLEMDRILANQGLVAILLVRAMTVADGVPVVLKRLGSEFIARIEDFEETKVRIDAYEACLDKQYGRQGSSQRVTSAFSEWEADQVAPLLEDIRVGTSDSAFDRATNNRLKSIHDALGELDAAITAQEKQHEARLERAEAEVHQRCKEQLSAILHERAELKQRMAVKRTPSVPRYQRGKRDGESLSNPPTESSRQQNGQPADGDSPT